jgi:cytochrome c-type biogenesis protein CcmH
MATRRIIFFIFCLWIFSLAHAEPMDRYPFSDEKQQKQFQTLIHEFRCLVCQNQNLADSNAGLANDLRQQIYDMVKNGKSNSEITEYMTARYGDFVLFNPPFSPETYFLWLAPFILLLLGGIILWRKVSS